MNRKIFSILGISVLLLSLIFQSCAGNKINLQDTLDTRETVQVKAYWDPIADASLGMPDQSPKHAALFKNLSPAHASREYQVAGYSERIEPDSYIH